MPTTFFNAFADLDEIQEIIKEEIGNKHAYNNELCEKTATGFKTIPLQQAEHYLSKSSLDTTTESIFILKQIENFVSRAPCLGTYQVQMQLPGQSGSIPLMRNTILALWGAETNPTFFDAEIMTNTGYLNCYSRISSVPGLEHSGDICSHHNGKPHFIHYNLYLGTKLGRDTTYAIAAVGYGQKPLHLFQSACPCIMLVDHSTRCLNVIPFSLEKSTIGNATLIAPVLFRLDGNKMKWHILSEPLTDNHVNTGTYSLEFSKKMKDAHTMFDRWFESGISSHTDVPNIPATDLYSPLQTKAEEITNCTLVEMVQDGLNIELQEDSFKLSFGVSLHEYSPASKPSVLLPICSGFAVGHPALALGRRSSLNISHQEYKNILNNAKCIIIHTSSGWNDSIMQAVVEKINGIMIYYTSTNLSLDKKTREFEMNDTSIPCTRFMGSLSVIFLKTPNGHTYLYRGSSNMWPGLMSDEHNYADEVDYQNILNWCRMPSKKCLFKGLIANVVSVHDKRVLYNNMVHDTFPYLSLNTDCSIPEIQFLFNQARIVLSSVETNALRDKLSLQFLDELNTKKAHLNKKLKDTIDSMNKSDISFLKDYTCKIKSIKRSMKEIDQKHIKIFELVESFSSEKLTSKRNVSIQQIQRKNIIQSNVTTAENMTTAEFGDMLMSATECCIVSELQTHDYFHDMLLAVSKSDIRNYLTQCTSSFANQIQNKHDFPLLCASKTCLTMESEIIPSLVQHNGGKHYLSSDGVQMTFVLQGRSCIVLPIFSNAKFVKGEYVNWMDEANNPDVATWRICFRKSLRLLHLRIPIDKQSQDLNVAIQLIILSTAWSLSLTMKKENVDFSNTTSELMRGLLYLWGTTCAAGNKPFSFAFTMLNPTGKIEVPKTKEEYILYAIVAHLFPFTGIDSKFMVNNTRIFIIKVIRKQIIDPVTEPMRKSLNELKETQNKNSEIQRNISLQWNQATSAIFTKLFKNSISEEKAKLAAHTLLHMKPDTLTYTGEKLIAALTIFLSKGRKGLSEDMVKQVIANSAAKRGAIMSSSKKSAIQNSSKSSMIIARRNDVLMKELDVPNFKVQNLQAFVDCDLARMKGDAELKRTPFNINSSYSIPDSKTYASLMSQALNLDTTIKSKKNISEKGHEDTLISRLSKIPNSKNAIHKAQNLHNLYFEDIFGSTSCLFISAAQITDKDVTIQKIVSCLLDHWQDLPKGENECLSLF